MRGGTTEHDTVDPAKMNGRLGQRRDAPVNDDCQMRMTAFQAIDALTVEGRNFAILPGRQAFEPRLTRMDDEGAAAGSSNRRDEGLKIFLIILLIDANAAFDSDLDGDAPLHGR